MTVYNSDNTPPQGSAFARGAQPGKTNRLPTPAQEAQQRLERGAMVTEPADGGPWTSTFKAIERWTHLSTGELVFKMYAGKAGVFPMEFKYTDAVLDAALANEPDDIQTQARSGQYKPDINWQVKWKRVNGWPTAIEVTRMNNQQVMDIPDTGKATTKPVTGDKPAVKVPHWTDDKARLGRFMASWKNLADARGITTEADRDEIRKRVQKSEHIHDTRYLDHALLKALREELDRLKPDTAPWGADDEQVDLFYAHFAEIGQALGLTPLQLQTRVKVEVFKLFKTQDMADLNIAREIVQDKVMAELQKALPTKSADPVQSDNLEEVFGRKPGEKPASGAKQDVPAIPIATPIPTRELVPQTAPVMGTANPMCEAAFVMLMSLYAPNGAEMKFTIRAMTADQLAERIDALIAIFVKRGYRAERETQPAPQTTAAPAPVAPGSLTPIAAPVPPAIQPAAQQTGTYRIGAVKKVMDEGKTRYELYGGANDDKPLLIARLDSVVSQTIALHIDINAMQVGTRYQVAWDADWKLGKVNQQSGRQYKDLMTIRAVQQAVA